MAKAAALGRKMKAARERAGLSQPQLARKVGIGPIQISRIERGSGTSSRTARRIAAVLGENEDEFASLALTEGLPKRDQESIRRFVRRAAPAA